MSARALYICILLVSAVGIAYQITLMRIFSIGQWHHFAYMIISIAMLGFGASGTMLALLRARIRGREAPLLLAGTVLLCFSLIACYWGSQRVPFETFQLVTQRAQLRYLLALYFVLAVPFFLVSTCITLGFFLRPREIGRLYCVNMVGSGLGAVGAVGALFLERPALMPYLLAVAAAVAVFAAAGHSGVRRALAGLLVLMMGALWLFGPHVPIRVSEYKGLSYTLQFPDAQVLGERVSPLSQVTAVSSELIRETPGQISNYPMEALGRLPRQIALFFDAGAISPIHEFRGDLSEFAFLDYVTASAAYRLVEAPHVLVVGAGGGTDVLNALMQGASQVTAVEVDPNVFRFVREDFGAFSGGLYDREDVTPVIADGRGYLQASREEFDLIQIALLDSFNASAAGVHALSESYLYTVEALALYLDRLSEEGVLSITRWLKTPPRDALKMFATAVEACERMGIENPADHLVFIRSWNTGTILVSKAPLRDAQVAAVREFAEARWFDLAHVPGIEPEDANRFILLDDPVYYTFAQGVLGPDREAWYDDALFYLRPPTDDRPHFFRFFQWKSLPRLIEGLGAEWVPFVEWGYITLVATLVQGALASVIVILLPLIVLARRPRAHRVKRWVVLYALALGLSFMLLELGFIQKFMLFLAYPIYAVSVVLTAFLLFSGLGSLYANRIRARRGRALGVVVLLMAVLVVLYLALLPGIFNALAGWPDPGKIAVSILLLAPLAFLMGIPFPLGLQWMSDTDETLLPWAWGINGCASVVGASLATLTAVHLGFQLLTLLALVLYTGAWLGMTRMERLGEAAPADTAETSPAP